MTNTIKALLLAVTFTTGCAVGDNLPPTDIEISVDLAAMPKGSADVMRGDAVELGAATLVIPSDLAEGYCLAGISFTAAHVAEVNRAYLRVFAIGADASGSWQDSSPVRKFSPSAGALHHEFELPQTRDDLFAHYVVIIAGATSQIGDVVLHGTLCR